MTYKSLTLLIGLGWLLVLAACKGSVSPESTAACAKPLQGQRYAVCGHLTTAPSPDQSPSGREIQGSVDSVTPRATGGHEVSGGSFHANH
jgi:hypothetical protein